MNNFWNLIENSLTFNLGKATIQDEFQTDENQSSYKQTLAIIQNQMILIDNNLPTAYKTFNFDTKFTFLKDRQTQKAIGIQFEGNSEKLNSVVRLKASFKESYKLTTVSLMFQVILYIQTRALKKIGKGNFASVYLVERLEDGKQFAVKAFSKETVFQQDQGKASLMNEISVMRQLNQKNILKLHDVFESDNSLYLVLDLLDGGQLYKKLRQKYNFKIDETRIIMKSFIDGLVHMHRNKIMHRDLKPENIMFKSQDSFEVIIADMGLSTRSDVEKYIFVRCGTPGFVAPEVVNIKDLEATYDPVCDIYSVGLIFHLLLLGKSPFGGKDYNQVLQLNREANIKFELPEYKYIPKDAFDLLQKMLEKDPTMRLTAQKCQNHPFFKSLNKKDEYDLDDELDDEITEKMKQLQLQLSPIQPLSGKLDYDSCVDFKFNQTYNSITGSSYTNAEETDRFSCFESPAINHSNINKKQIQQMRYSLGSNTTNFQSVSTHKDSKTPSIFNQEIAEEPSLENDKILKKSKKQSLAIMNHLRNQDV